MNTYTHKESPSAYIACFGKSTVPKHEASYHIATKIAETLVENGLGLLHGGYSGGLMEAVDTAAVRRARELGSSKPESWAVGLPIACFEEGWGITEHGTRLTPVLSIEDRLTEFCTRSSGTIVLPYGGLGTMHELLHVITRAKYFPESRKPLILFGQHWESSLDAMLGGIESKDTTRSFPWIKTVTTIDECMSAIQDMAQEILG